MANEQNLIPQAHKLTVEEQSKGGKASGEARRNKKDLREALEILLEAEHNVKDKRTGKETKMLGTDILATAIYQKAQKGNTKAFELIRDTIGQKPIEKIQNVEIDQSVIDEVEKMVFKDD
jgi:hypothetical protein